MATPPSGLGAALGAGGLPLVRLRAADGAAADVYLHGAHVTSWRPAPDGEERLFLSTRSEFRHGTAIRGGVPVIFPQFAAEGPLPRHGFARTAEWTLEEMLQHDDGRALAILSLQDSPATREVWPASFRVTLTASVGGARLAVTLMVENTGRETFVFTTALHSYLRVHDAGDVEVLGLKGTEYRESAKPGVLRVDRRAAVHVEGELDRVYVDVPREITVREPDRALDVTLEEFPDLVLWNPGPERAAALRDLEPGGERKMLCVEAAAVQRPVVLAPGREWSGTQIFDAGSRKSRVLGRAEP
jgi:glucose-6-phosphate 1-epimerase